jgi:hypothetical protein
MQESPGLICLEWKDALHSARTTATPARSTTYANRDYGTVENADNCGIADNLQPLLGANNLHDGFIQLPRQREQAALDARIARVPLRS